MRYPKAVEVFREATEAELDQNYGHSDPRVRHILAMPVERCEHYRLDGHWGPAENVVKDGINVEGIKRWCKGAGLDEA